MWDTYAKRLRRKKKDRTRPPFKVGLNEKARTFQKGDLSGRTDELFIISRMVPELVNKVKEMIPFTDKTYKKCKCPTMPYVTSKKS